MIKNPSFILLFCDKNSGGLIKIVEIVDNDFTSLLLNLFTKFSILQIEKKKEVRSVFHVGGRLKAIFHIHFVPLIL